MTIILFYGNFYIFRILHRHVSFCIIGLNHVMLVSYDFRFLRMRDFDMSKAKEMFVNYLKWREDFGVDTISKVNKTTLIWIIIMSENCVQFFLFIHDSGI